MKQYKSKILASVFAVALLTAGCDRTVSQEQSSDVRSDGTVKTETETVTRNSDGTLTKTEETKKTDPATNP